MPAYKDNRNGKWYVMVRYKDEQNNRKQKCKRGFSTKRDAESWEKSFLQQSDGNLSMSFSAFIELYIAYKKPRCKESTWITKSNIIEHFITPYFCKMKINEIQPKDVSIWQTSLLNTINPHTGKTYSAVYLRTIHSQLSAIFNYAVRFYGLKSNPAAKAGSMGKAKAEHEMLFWTQDEYKSFSNAIMDKPLSFYAFQMLYWCGIREGELLALTPNDFNFERGTVTINKSYQRINGKDLITSPKTEKSNRTITMPEFLCEQMQDFVSMQYDLQPTDRLFTVTKHYLKHEMDRGSKLAGVKRIRIHDLRHSHISLLIEAGFSAVAIADRVGHESIDITYNYAHLFPSAQTEMANVLDSIAREETKNVSKKS